LINYFFPFYPKSVINNWQETKYITAGIVVFLTTIILIYGYLNALDTKFVHHNIIIDDKELQISNK
jgi:hypothetical protein